MEEHRRETIARLEQLLAKALVNSDRHGGTLAWHNGRASYVGNPEGRTAWEAMAGECGRIIASMPDLRPMLGDDVMGEPDDVQRWCRAMRRMGVAR
jgi:hypothetical protein